MFLSGIVSARFSLLYCKAYLQDHLTQFELSYDFFSRFEIFNDKNMKNIDFVFLMWFLEQCVTWQQRSPVGCDKRRIVMLVLKADCRIKVEPEKYSNQK